MYEIKPKRLRSQILTCSVFLALFSKNHGFVKKSNPSEKTVIIVEEELDCIDIDDTGKLEDSPRLVFIDEEYGNLMVVNDVRNISQKKKSDFLQFFISQILSTQQQMS